MPVVAFPVSSGLTEQDVAQLVLDETQRRVDEIRREVRMLLNGLEAINTRFNRLAGMTQPDADAEFANLDAQLQQLLTLRHTLQIRVDAHLSQQRIAASVAAHPQTKVA